jgi:3-deoxy-D-manno-octulosonic-acid transferase
VTTALHEAGGLTVVATPADLPHVIGPLLNDPTAARAMGERARRAAADAGAGLDRLWDSLQPLLPPAPPVARGRL